MDENLQDWPSERFKVVSSDGTVAWMPSRAYLQKLIIDTVNQNTPVKKEQTDMSDIVSPVAGQPFVVTNSDHDNHDDKWLTAAALREAAAGQRETNAAFRSADGDRSRNALHQAEVARDEARESERNHAKNREFTQDSERRTAEKIYGLEKTVADLANQIKAEAIATRELLRDQEMTRMADRARLAESKIVALYTTGNKPSDPSI